MLLNFQLGENCPCPEEIREELYDFHEDLLLHCGELPDKSFIQDKAVHGSLVRSSWGVVKLVSIKIIMLIVQEMILSKLFGSEKI